MSEEQRIGACKAAINQISNMLRCSPQQWRNFLALARTIIAQLDSTTFMQDPTRTSEQVPVVAALQILAFKDVDNGAVVGIASWCSRQWLALLQRDAGNLAALRGLGQMWLYRAQPALARIHASQGSSSSGASGSSRSESAAEAERRIGTADYVEARGLLQPAAEYLERAVTAASNQGVVSGDLLAKAAEAYMSIGNVSGPRTNQQYFRRALQLLQRASDVEDYALPGHLQKYLDDYGRLFR
ncbi:hypothetical protein MBLNU13_g03969t1 [Cladosporium sp. NU13]